MIQINQPAYITAGILQGQSGTLVAHYSLEQQVEIELDSETSVIIGSQCIRQGGVEHAEA